MKKNDKKRIILISSTVCIVIVSVILCMFILSRIKGKTYERCAVSVIVEATKKGEEKVTTTIDIREDGKTAQVDTSFSMNPLYVTNGEIYYQKAGRFNRIKSEYSYRDLYSIVKKIDVSKQDGNYHPHVSQEIINEMLKSLFIDYELNGDTVGNVLVNNGKIEEFSVYLRNFYAYETLAIIISFENLEEDFEVHAPIFYEEVTDDVDGRELRFIK